MMKKIIRFLSAILVFAVIILLLLFGKGFGFGNGFGKGDDDGNGQAVVESADDDRQDQSSEPAELTDEEIRSLPDRITVTIKEDQVFVEDRQIKDADELREYLEVINNDSREYVLNDEQSILATYEWVKAVFDELKIELSE